MKRTLTLLTLVATLGVAQAADVFVTRDAQGRPVYTDRPEQLPAERLDIKTSATDTVAVQQRYEAQMKQYGESEQASAEAAKKAAEAKQADASTEADRAKRCQESRDRYLSYMNSRRLYEPGEGGERRYLSDAELDDAREKARQVMDEFCGES
jgi:hypothetical protein